MLNHHIQANAIKQHVDKAGKILVVSHKKPDADTLGSACAWLSLLTSRGKEAHAFCLDPVPDNLKFLPESHRISTDRRLFNQQLDLIIVNDSGSPDYAGVDVLLLGRPKDNCVVVNIDHHATNTLYADINLVIPDASSTTEVLSRLFAHWEEPMTKPIAQALLTGLITDTDRLMNPATSHRSFAIASQLVAAGGDLYEAIQRTLNNKSVADLKLWGIAFSRLRRNPRYDCVATYLTHEDVMRAGGTEDTAEGIINYLSLIPDARVIMMLRTQADGSIKGSFRTTKEGVDVGKLAFLMGGGGHKKASGFTIFGKLLTEGTRWTIV